GVRATPRLVSAGSEAESFSQASEAVTEHRGPLRVIQRRAVVPTDQSFHKIAAADRPIHDAVDESRAGIAGERGVEFLIAAKNLHAECIRQTLGEGNGFILPAAERTVEL